MIKALRKKLSFLDEHTLEVAKKSFSSTIIKVLGLLVSLGISVFLGRTLGPEGLGIINLANRILSILLIFSLLGNQKVILKEIAISFNKNDSNRIDDIIYSSVLLNVIIGVLIGVLIALFTPQLANLIFDDKNLIIPLLIFLIALVPQIIARIISSGLIGYKKIWQSNLVDKTLSSVVIGFVLSIYWLFNFKFSVINVSIAYTIALCTVAISMAIYWRKLNRTRPLFKKFKLVAKELFATGHSIFTMEIAVVISSNASIILIGALLQTKDIGLYAVASNLALLTTFFLQVTNSSLSPKIASLYEEGNLKSMELMVRRLTCFLMIIGIGVLLTFVVFGKFLLSIWGNEFIEAYWILVILGSGQLFNLGTGAVGVLLNMTGHEKIHRNISIGFMIISIPLSYVLIKTLGIIGAALSAAVIVTLENLTKLIATKVYLKINIIPFKF